MESAVEAGLPRPAWLLGVTGTNGKTTTTTLLSWLLERTGRPSAFCSTVETRIGGAPSELRRFGDLLHECRRQRIEHVVCEVTSLTLSRGFALRNPFDLAIFTNLTHDHLCDHKTPEHYLAAKSTLFASLRSGERQSIAVLNGDDPCSALVAEVVPPGARLLTFGLSPAPSVELPRTPELHLFAEEPASSLSGATFVVRAGPRRIPAWLPIPGKHMVQNALSALAALGAMGLDPEEAASHLATFRTVAGRFEAVEPPAGAAPGPAVFVDYAHTPDGLERTLATAREIAPGQLYVVFGCGGDRDLLKRPEMGRIAAAGADHVVVTTDNPRSEEPALIAAAILRGARGPHVELILDRQEAIRYAVSRAGDEDVVVIAGKGHEDTQEIRGVKLRFSDHDEARAALAARDVARGNDGDRQEEVP